MLLRGLALRGVPRLAPSRLDGRAELIFVFAGDRSGSTEERNISLDVTTPIIVRGCGVTSCDVAGTGDGGVKTPADSAELSISCLRGVDQAAQTGAQFILM